MSQDAWIWLREFQLWHYSVSHSTLVLRSLEGGDPGRRIDVAFFSVRAMHVRDSYESLSLVRKTPTESLVLWDASWEIEPLVMFEINNGPDYVLSASIAWQEDEGGYRDPSRFGPLPGLEGYVDPELY